MVRHLNMFKKIITWLKNITGNCNCNSVQELVRYIKPGDLEGLNYWVTNKIWYRKDVDPSDEWDNLNAVMVSKESDCEEKAAIRTEVIKSWPGWDAQNVVLHMPENISNHAICAFEGPEVRGVMDDSRLACSPITVPLDQLIKANWPKAINYMVCDKHGFRV